LKVFNKF